MVSYTQAIGLMLAAFCLFSCDPDYGGIVNSYPEAVRVTLHSDDPHVPLRNINLSSGQRFSYHWPTKLFEINVTTADGITTTYSSTTIDKIASDIHEPNEMIIWAVMPEGLFADCVQHALIRTCRKPGVPPTTFGGR